MRTNDPFEIKIQKGFTQNAYPGSNSVKPIFSCVRAEGIEPIARQSLLSDERHILFYSEARELSIVDHFTLKCHSFSSKELSDAKWPENRWNTLGAWHLGLVLLYNGHESPGIIKSFYINLSESSLREGSNIKIPDNFQRFEVTAISIDQQQIYIAFNSKPRKILVWNRETNTVVAKLVMLGDESNDMMTEITDVVIRKDRIAAITRRGHTAIWNQPLAGGPSTDADISPDKISRQVDSLKLDLETGMERILMSQDCERIVVLDPLWCDDTAYLTQSLETVQIIPARKHGDIAESFLRVDEECRIAAVGVIPYGVRDAASPLIKIFVANEDNPQMVLPQFGPKLGLNIGDFIDFSLHQNSVKYYGTKGIISIGFGEVKSLPDDFYTCSRYIPMSSQCWKGMRRLLMNSEVVPHPHRRHNWQ